MEHHKHPGFIPSCKSTTLPVEPEKPKTQPQPKFKPKSFVYASAHAMSLKSNPVIEHAALHFIDKELTIVILNDSNPHCGKNTTRGTVMRHFASIAAPSLITFNLTNKNACPITHRGSAMSSIQAQNPKMTTATG